MYPFYVLSIAETATDTEVEARYHKLLRDHPPDTDPEMFRLIHTAYEAVATEAKRRRARLFHHDRTGKAITESLPRFLAGSKPPRMSEEALARLLKAGAR